MNFSKIRKEISNNSLLKFMLLLVVLSTYFFYLSFKYGFASGGIVSILTWSFFVLCTPIADAGFLLDFPLRLLLGVRMFISEIFVWATAILFNAFALEFFTQEYQKTFLTSLLHKILLTPNPYWLIIFISAIGTFLSIRFGDDVYDAAIAKKSKVCSFKVRIVSFVIIFAVVIAIYHHLLQSLGISF